MSGSGADRASVRAVRAGPAERSARQRFLERGLAALEASRARDDYVSADECVARLRDKLERARGTGR